tara:strand:- start:171 stop:371 length:201 start_codon:yes stop_codon:yes gene_type:complete
MAIIYSKNGTPYFDHPLTPQEQLLYDKIVGDSMFNPPVGMGSLRSIRTRTGEKGVPEEGHKDGEEA